VRAERTKRARRLACVVPAAPEPPSAGAFLVTTAGASVVVVVGSGDGSVGGATVVVVVVVVTGAGGAPSLQSSVSQDCVHITLVSPSSIKVVHPLSFIAIAHCLETSVGRTSPSARVIVSEIVEHIVRSPSHSPA